MSGSPSSSSAAIELRTGDILSARAGIHYRVLFRIEERSLVVASITHRRNLEQAIASL